MNFRARLSLFSLEARETPDATAPLDPYGGTAPPNPNDPGLVAPPALPPGGTTPTSGSVPPASDPSAPPMMPPPPPSSQPPAPTPPPPPGGAPTDPLLAIDPNTGLPLVH